MNATEAAGETLKLLETLKALGGPSPSPELQSYLRKALGKSAQRSASPVGRSTSATAGRKSGKTNMFETIQQLAARLERAFENDSGFEAAVSQAEASGLTKDNVVELYNRVFRTSRNFPKNVTKPGLFKAIRQDRLKKVRDRH